MTDEIHPIAELTDAALGAMLHRAIRLTLGIGLVASLILWIASGWRNAAMLAVGAAISAASILEWQRLIRLFNAKLDRQKTPKGAVMVVTFFLLRLLIFAGVIYGSLKCLRGSVLALLCGLALAMVAMAYEAIRLLRD
ncbi:MAG TPA: ATP synthase subunit I [Terracidiphilus sp.]|nr:ATP synthase subunit I [Terracidiphilus sp.]